MTNKSNRKIREKAEREKEKKHRQTEYCIHRWLGGHYGN